MPQAEIGPGNLTSLSILNPRRVFIIPATTYHFMRVHLGTNESIHLTHVSWEYVRYYLKCY